MILTWLILFVLSEVTIVAKQYDPIRNLSVFSSRTKQKPLRLGIELLSLLLESLNVITLSYLTDGNTVFLLLINRI